MLKIEIPKGHLHPITSVIREVSLIFDELGYAVRLGPELEDEFHNFDALNTPADHPARDMQDTFWVKSPKGEGRVLDSESGAVLDRNQKILLRTHTSSVQIRFLESLKDKPQPFKIIVPGKVFRNEATDSTHEAQFHQVEGLYVNKNVSLAELKGTLEFFLKKLLGSSAKIRFRPSYFSFVEPGIEVDVFWNGKWLEMCGAGLVHPKVFESVQWNPKEWKGFAFGLGIDRVVMLRYGVDDIRHLYSGDLRLIKQF